MSEILLKQKDYEELSQTIFDLNLKIMEKNKEIERLKKRLEESQLGFLQLDKDKQRLNNIMTELEIELYAKYHEHKDSECEELYAKAQEDKEILDYIKELKERKK